MLAETDEEFVVAGEAEEADLLLGLPLLGDLVGRVGRPILAVSGVAQLNSGLSKLLSEIQF